MSPLRRTHKRRIRRSFGEYGWKKDPPFFFALSLCYIDESVTKTTVYESLWLIQNYSRLSFDHSRNRRNDGLVSLKILGIIYRDD